MCTVFKPEHGFPIFFLEGEKTWQQFAIMQCRHICCLGIRSRVSPVHDAKVMDPGQRRYQLAHNAAQLKAHKYEDICVSMGFSFLPFLRCSSVVIIGVVAV